MRRGALTLVLAVAAVAAARNGAAQAPLVTQRLDSGTVVRLRLPDGVLERGRLLAPFARDSVAFSLCPWPGRPCAPADARAMRHPAADVLAVEVHRGSAWRVGAVLGALLGVPVGLQFAQWDYAGDEGGGNPVTARQKTRSVLRTSVGFALFGAMIGEFIQVWDRAP